MRRTLLLVLAIGGAPIAADAGATFMGIGDIPGGPFSSTPWAVSADGRAVVGRGRPARVLPADPIDEAFRWSEDTGMLGLGATTRIANGVSGDGLVVVGVGKSATGSDEAFRWTAEGGLVAMGTFPGGSLPSVAYDASADGSVIVGFAYSASGSEAFRWTASEGMVGLGDLEGEPFWSDAQAVSADGTVVVGGAHTESGAVAFRWTESEGMVPIGFLPGDEASGASDVSADGSVVVGNSSAFGRQEAFRWTQSGGIVGLGDLPGGAVNSRALAVSADGSVVVGWGTSATGQEAAIWDSTSGIRSLEQVLVDDHGLDMSGWTLFGVHDVSADGHTIVGSGVGPNGLEAWIATITPDSPCDDGIDNDRDEFVDLEDPGCDSVMDTDERGDLLVCDDGIDNDGDGRADFTTDVAVADPGCRSIRSRSENPQCQDGLNNDGQGGIDFDGGASLDLNPVDGFIDAQFNPATPPVGARDLQCTSAWIDLEATSTSAQYCGLGPELAVVASALWWLRRRRERRR